MNEYRDLIEHTARRIVNLAEGKHPGGKGDGSDLRVAMRTMSIIIGLAAEIEDLAKAEQRRAAEQLLRTDLEAAL